MAVLQNRNLIGTVRLTAPAGQSLEVVRCNLSAIRPLTPLVCVGDVRFSRCNLTNRLLVDGTGAPRGDVKADHCQVSQILFEAAAVDSKTGAIVGTGIEATRESRLTRAHWVGRGITGQLDGAARANVDAAAAVEVKAVELGLSRSGVTAS